MYRGVEGTLYEGEILRLAQRPCWGRRTSSVDKISNLRVGPLQPGCGQQSGTVFGVLMMSEATYPLSCVRAEEEGNEQVPSRFGEIREFKVVSTSVCRVEMGWGQTLRICGYMYGGRYVVEVRGVR